MYDTLMYVDIYDIRHPYLMSISTHEINPWELVKLGSNNVKMDKSTLLTSSYCPRNVEEEFCRVSTWNTWNTFLYVGVFNSHRTKTTKTVQGFGAANLAQSFSGCWFGTFCIFPVSTAVAFRRFLPGKSRGPSPRSWVPVSKSPSHPGSLIDGMEIGKHWGKRYDMGGFQSRGITPKLSTLNIFKYPRWNFPYNLEGVDPLINAL